MRVAAVVSRKLHPSLDFRDDLAFVGIVTEVGAYQVVSSERKILTAARAKEEFSFLPRAYPDLAGRWPDADLDSFLETGGAPTLSDVLALTINAIDRHLELPRQEHRAFLATWNLASYFYPLFLTFPRLNLSGERESGKSKALTLLRATAFNALLMLNPTPAVLYRLVKEFRPTILLDEVEGLSREDARDILAIINSGYKQGGSVPRCEGDKTKRVELYEVYSPLALAAIKTLNATTEDRCIPLVLQRGRDPDRLNREIDLSGPEFGRIRAGCYRLLLTRWQEVSQAYEGLSLPAWLNSRARELWKPLLTIAEVADAEDGFKVGSDLTRLARQHVEDRDSISAEGEALISVLADRLVATDTLMVHPGELSDALQKKLGWQQPPTPETVGALLRRFGIPRAKPRRDSDGVLYSVTADRLEEIRGCYLVQQHEDSA